MERTELSGEAEKLAVCCTIRNAGDRAAKEIVQLYVSDPVASITRPVKSLRNCAKIDLAPGEAKTVAFEVTVEDLKFYNQNLEQVWEPGEFVIHIGPNSRDTQNTSVFWCGDGAFGEGAAPLQTLSA